MQQRRLTGGAVLRYQKEETGEASKSMFR